MRYLLILLLLTACTPTPNWTDGYYPTWDGSTACENYPVGQSDVNMSVSGDVLSLVANTQNRAGAYVGAIAGKVYPFTDNSTYTLTGSFQKPVGSQPEQIDANIQWVDENYIEHYAEIIWSLNPYSPLYGKVWTRNVSDQPIILYNLGDDNNWHTFSITASHNGSEHTINNISIDNQTFDIDIPEGTLVKTYNSRLTVLLEVQNMYPNCSPFIATKGFANFKNVNLSIETPSSQ